MARFGGRGHDFDRLDERANAEGGMLVIATSIPDAREWAQWKGRTARQDRPGQYLVVLSAEDEPFASEPGLAEALSALPADEIIAELLRRKDAGIAASLASFEAEQARGAWLNELCERYYREHSRAGGVDTAWPSQHSRRADLKLRAMLEVPFSSGALYLPTSPLYLPISPYISLYLPRSPSPPARRFARRPPTGSASRLRGRPRRGGGRRRRPLGSSRAGRAWR